MDLKGGGQSLHPSSKTHEGREQVAYAHDCHPRKLSIPKALRRLDLGGRVIIADEKEIGVFLQVVTNKKAIHSRQQKRTCFTPPSVSQATLYYYYRYGRAVAN